MRSLPLRSTSPGWSAGNGTEAGEIRILPTEFAIRIKPYGLITPKVGPSPRAQSCFTI